MQLQRLALVLMPLLLLLLRMRQCRPPLLLHKTDSCCHSRCCQSSRGWQTRCRSHCRCCSPRCCCWPPLQLKHCWDCCCSPLLLLPPKLLLLLLVLLLQCLLLLLLLWLVVTQARRCV